MPRVDTFRLSFSVLDGDEPQHWTIWSLSFPAVDKLVRGTDVRISPYTTRSEFFLLDQTAEQLNERDSWTNVIGTVIHMTDKDHLERLRTVHQQLCQYIRREPEALCNRLGYYVLPVVEPKEDARPHVDPQLHANYAAQFVRDAKMALGTDVAEGPYGAECAHDLQRSLVNIAQRIIILHEMAEDR